MNSAFVGYEELSRSREVLSTKTCYPARAAQKDWRKTEASESTTHGIHQKDKC